MGVVGNITVTGDTTQIGTISATTLSGATVKIGGGATTLSATSCYNTTTTAAQTLSGATIRTTAANTSITDTKITTNKISATTTAGTAALSGRTLQVNPFTTNSSYILCQKDTGVIGYLVRTATGFVRSTCN